MTAKRDAIRHFCRIESDLTERFVTAGTFRQKCRKVSNFKANKDQTKTKTWKIARSRTDFRTKENPASP